MDDNFKQLQNIVEAALLAAQRPLSVDQLRDLWPEDERPTRTVIEHVLSQIDVACENRGFELRLVASGYRFQIREAYAPWVGRLWEEKPQRYSRALLETLALVAYRQPITRGEIEDVRGVAVSSNIVRTLQERGWIRVVGQRDVPGRPSMYATTREFLDYFNLKALDQLPSLADIRDLDEIGREFEARLQAELEFDESTAETADNSDTFH